MMDRGTADEAIPAVVDVQHRLRVVGQSLIGEVAAAEVEIVAIQMHHPVKSKADEEGDIAHQDHDLLVRINDLQVKSVT